MERAWIIQVPIHYGEGLIAVGKTTHTAHNAENIVVNSEDLKTKGNSSLGSSVSKLENSIINTAEIAGTAGLVLLRGEGK